MIIEFMKYGGQELKINNAQEMRPDIMRQLQRQFKEDWGKKQKKE